MLKISKSKQQKINKLLLMYGDKIISYIEKNDCQFGKEYFIKNVVASDPDEKGKSVKWILNNILNGNILLEDVESGDESKVHDTLNRFYNIRKQFADQSLRDINQFKRLGDVAEQLRGFEIIQSNKEIKKDKKEQIYKDTIFLYNQNGYLVVVPKTQEASCFWGLGTEWCTAATKSRNYFNNYNESGPLYICITPDGKKYQFHKNSQPMDENDNPINNIVDPVLRELALITGRMESIKEINYLSERECLEFCKNNIIHIKNIPKDIPNYAKFCLKLCMVNGLAIEHIPNDIDNYAECCLEACKNNGWAIKFLPHDIDNYEECCLEAVKQNGYVIKDIPRDIDNYEQCCLEAVKQDGWYIKYINRGDISNYEECCLEAVKNNGYVIKDIPRDIDNYEQCCLESVKQKGRAIRFIPTDISNYEECCLEACKSNGWTIEFITRNISNYEECCLEACKSIGFSIKHIPRDISNYDECLKISKEFKEKQKEEIKEEVVIPDWIEDDVLKNKEFFNKLIIPQVKNNIKLLI